MGKFDKLAHMLCWLDAALGLLEIQMKWHFAEQKMRGQCQAGQGVREEVAGGAERVIIIPPLCDGHSAVPGGSSVWGMVSISTGIHILGLPHVSWVFGPQVHPLECRMLNLLLSLHPSDLHCPGNPALSSIGTWSVLWWGCNPSIASEGESKLGAAAGGWLAGIV